MIRATLPAGNYVIDFEVLWPEVFATTRAASTLLAVQIAFVLGVVVPEDVSNIRPVRNIRPMGSPKK